MMMMPMMTPMMMLMTPPMTLPMMMSSLLEETGILYSLLESSNIVVATLPAGKETNIYLYFDSF